MRGPWRLRVAPVRIGASRPAISSRSTGRAGPISRRRSTWFTLAALANRSKTARARMTRFTTTPMAGARAPFATASKCLSATSTWSTSVIARLRRSTFGVFSPSCPRSVRFTSIGLRCAEAISCAGLEASRRFLRTGCDLSFSDNEKPPRSSSWGVAVRIATPPGALFLTSLQPSPLYVRTHPNVCRNGSARCASSSKIRQSDPMSPACTGFMESETP